MHVELGSTTTSDKFNRISRNRWFNALEKLLFHKVEAEMQTEGTTEREKSNNHGTSGIGYLDVR